METFDSDIIDLQKIVDLLKVIEMGFTEDANKKRKLDKSVNSTTDLAKIRQERDEALNGNKILKLEQSLLQKHLLQELSDCRRGLSESQRENDELKCSELEPSGITDNSYTSMTICLLAIGKCTNTDSKWKDRDIQTLILALQLPLVGVCSLPPP